jgi:hypothetical protein
MRNRHMKSIQTTGEKSACLYDATSAFDNENNLDGLSDIQGNTRTDRAAIYWRSSDKKNLWWTGQLMRMSPDKLPKQDIYSQLSYGHRKIWRPRLRFKDTTKRNLKLHSWLYLSNLGCVSLFQIASNMQWPDSNMLLLVMPKPHL